MIETCTSAKLAWVSLPVAHGYKQYPPMDCYDGLIAEFARRES